MDNVVAFKTGNNRCHICNGIGHWARDCRNKTKQRKSVQKYENCNRIGHAKNHCRWRSESKKKINIVLFVRETITLITNVFIEKNSQENIRMGKTDKVAFLTTTKEEKDTWRRQLLSLWIMDEISLKPSIIIINGAEFLILPIIYNWQLMLEKF